jgi:hypothetical protein
MEKKLKPWSIAEVNDIYCAGQWIPCNEGKQICKNHLNPGASPEFTSSDRRKDKCAMPSDIATPIHIKSLFAVLG